jgi:hypothetical protein
MSNNCNAKPCRSCLWWTNASRVQSVWTNHPIQHHHMQI